MAEKCVKTIQELRELREMKDSYFLKSKDYENSVNRYASWAYQQTFLVFLLNFLGFTVILKKNKEGNTHRFARMQTIVYQIDNVTLQNIMEENNSQNANHSNDEMNNEIVKENNENEIVESSNSQIQTTQMEEENGKNQFETTECHSTESNENVCLQNENILQQKNDQINNQKEYNNVTKTENTTNFTLFEDTEYFESICSSQQKRNNGSKNINDFAKMSSLFMMYFFNTFGIEFKIKGEGKTFPMITEIKFRDTVIPNAIIQDFGRRHFSEMVRGIQLYPETVLLKEQENDENSYATICAFFMNIQQAVYSNVKEYILFIQFITQKFYNLYCNDDRLSVEMMQQINDETELKYCKK